MLRPLPGILIARRLSKELHFVHAFFTHAADLEADFFKLRDALAKNGTLWVSWPKTSSPLSGDLDGNRVRAIGLANGLVDVKVCAVDDDWSALKFVCRLSDR